MISTAEAVKALHSTQCAGCGKLKGHTQSVCGQCWKLLPGHMQRALYRRMGDGYEQAYDEALRCIEQRRQTASEVYAGKHTRGRKA